MSETPEHLLSALTEDVFIDLAVLAAIDPILEGLEQRYGPKALASAERAISARILRTIFAMTEKLP